MKHTWKCISLSSNSDNVNKRSINFKKKKIRNKFSCNRFASLGAMIRAGYSQGYWQPWNIWGTNRIKTVPDTWDPIFQGPVYLPRVPRDVSWLWAPPLSLAQTTGHRQ